MYMYDLNNTDSSSIIDQGVCRSVLLVFEPPELQIRVFTYAEDFSVIPTSKKLQFDVVTQQAPAVFISLCITASLFLSVSNENILLFKTKKEKEYVKHICSTMFFISLIHVQSSCEFEGVQFLCRLIESLNVHARGTVHPWPIRCNQHLNCWDNNCTRMG